MKVSRAGITLLSLALAGCTDLPTAEPAESGIVQAGDEAGQASLPLPAAPMSTICAAHRQQLAAVNVQLADRPTDTRLNDAATDLENIIANTCD